MRSGSAVAFFRARRALSFASQREGNCITEIKLHVMPVFEMMKDAHKVGILLPQKSVTDVGRGLI